MPKELPLRAMADVCWSFVGEVTADRDGFDARVRQYQIRIRKRDSWKPERVAIPAPRIVVRYRCWEGDEQVEQTVPLTAEDGAAFTAGELLFALHNATVDRLRDRDHRFFEGLTLTGWDEGVPVYELRLGS